MSTRRSRTLTAVLSFTMLSMLAGCGGSSSTSELSGQNLGGSFQATDSRALTGYATLQPFQDAWPSSAPRFLDVGDVEFLHATGPAVIEVKYDPAPTVPYFVGALKASGLKPNFCYQLKLVGKPGKSSSSAPGLWGYAADNTTNKALLQAGRWWNYRTEDPAFTTTNDTQVLRTTDYKNGWVAGYLYFGFVMTDAAGNAAWSFSVNPNSSPAQITKQSADPDGWVAIASAGSFHITGKDSQSITKSTTLLTHTSLRPASAYGSELVSSDTSLWLEKEPDDPIAVSLPNGSHDVVLMLTEESFHSSGLGGYWETVYVSNWSSGTSPVSGLPWISAPGSAITFQTGPPPQTMVAVVSVSWVKSLSRYQPIATVAVTSNGARLSAVAVAGTWSGAYTASVSGTTGTAGTVQFKGPRVRTKSYVAFDVTSVTKTGYALDAASSSLHGEASN